MGSIKSCRNFLKLKRISFNRYQYYSESISKNQKELVVEELTDKYSGVTTFGLNRPEKKNALGADLVNLMEKQLDKIYYEDKTRILIIRSLVKSTFCSGADLKERITMKPSEISNFVNRLRSLTNRLHNLPIPVIASIDGIAFGGGLELALACDVRIVSSNAKLGLVETKLAIIPGAGGTQRLPRLINPSIAKELIYTARIIDGKEAVSLGIANHVVDQNDNGDASYLKTLDLCEQILQNGPVALKMAKVALNKGLEVDLQEGLAIEEGCYSRVIPTKDRTEALEAFQSKRKPIFRGE